MKQWPVAVIEGMSEERRSLIGMPYSTSGVSLATNHHRPLATDDQLLITATQC